MATDCGPNERPRRPASRRPEGTAIVGKVAAGVPTGRTPPLLLTIAAASRPGPVGVWVTALHDVSEPAIGAAGSHPVPSRCLLAQQLP